MSKVVNPDRMSKFDRQYLQDRGIDPDEYAEKFTFVDGQVVPRDEVEADEVEADEIPPYSEWVKKDLQAEIDKRNAEREAAGLEPLDPASDKNDDLVAVLEADDAERADDE